MVGTAVATTLASIADTKIATIMPTVSRMVWAVQVTSPAVRTLVVTAADYATGWTNSTRLPNGNQAGIGRSHRPGPRDRPPTPPPAPHRGGAALPLLQAPQDVDQLARRLDEQVRTSRVPARGLDV